MGVRWWLTGLGAIEAGWGLCSPSPGAVSLESNSKGRVCSVIFYTLWFISRLLGTLCAGCSWGGTRFPTEHKKERREILSGAFLVIFLLQIKDVQQLDTSISCTHLLLRNVSIILKYCSCVNQKLLTCNFINCLLLLFSNLYYLECLKIKMTSAVFLESCANKE